jgi:hypothetical protein
MQSRIRKTRELFANRKGFENDLARDIEALVSRAESKGLVPCVRVNGTSDLPWLAKAMAKRFPNVQFYDYTKHPEPWKHTLPNYDLTFSHSERNLQDSMYALGAGINVAVVFDTKRGQPLPKFWEGYKVIDGDVSDLRFLDPKGKVVGLRAKGRAKKDCTGFVVKSPLVQIGNSLQAVHGTA